MRRRLYVILALSLVVGFAAVAAVVLRQPTENRSKPLPTISRSPVVSPGAGTSSKSTTVPPASAMAPGRGGESKTPESTPKATSPPVSATEISRGNTAKHNLIFTFDCGAGIQSLRPILQTLAAYHVKGTFFMTGKWVQANPAAARQIADAGHEIFNHTYDHPYLTQLSEAKIMSELDQAETAIWQFTGRTSRPFFRPPYGDRNQQVLLVAAVQGYQSVYWTVDALDWKEPDGYSAAQSQNRILSTLANGNIYLMHVGDNITGSILGSVFAEATSRGYTMVSLTQGL